MYEDSQRFSEEEGDESSHIVSINPRSMKTQSHDCRSNAVGGTELRDPITHMMQRGVDGNTSSLIMGANDDVDTPKFDDPHTNIREESLQRILRRLSPNG